MKTEWIFFADEELFYEYADGNPTGRCSEDPYAREAYECTFNRGSREERKAWVSS